MNSSEVRRLALLGAAKVAFSAALVGCGGVVVVAGESPGEGGGGTAGGGPTPVPWGTGTAATGATSGSYGATTAVSSSATGDAATTCGATTTAPFSSDAIACCKSLIQATFANGPVFLAPPPTPDLVSCCDMALTVRDGKVPGAPPADTFDFSSTYGCCQVAGVEPPKPFSPTCSPWGPPVPPAMPEGLDWLEEAA